MQRTENFKEISATSNPRNSTIFNKWFRKQDRNSCFSDII